MQRQRQIVPLALVAAAAFCGLHLSGPATEDGRRSLQAAAAAAAAPSPIAAADENVPNGPLVAHCLVGQGRTMDHPMIHQNYEAHVLSKIGAPSDVYFVIDAPANGTDVYRPVAVDYVPITSAYWQFLRWGRCLDMISEHENRTGAEYSHVIMGRVDQLVLQDLPSIDTFPQKSIWAKPYGELMDEYAPTYKSGDEGAIPPQQVWKAISDLFLVLPRHVAPELMREIEMIYGGDWTCGAAPRLKGHSSEMALKCAASRGNVPVTFQPFQLRILRPHGRGGCGSFTKDLGLGGKHYNSLCI